MDAAVRWLEAGAAYRDLYSRLHGSAAVVHVTDTHGGTTIYTRGEYAEAMLAVPRRDYTGRKFIFGHVSDRAVQS